MTFRQRMIIAFSMVIVLPMLLFTVAFMVIGNALARGEDRARLAALLDAADLKFELAKEAVRKREKEER